MRIPLPLVALLATSSLVGCAANGNEEEDAAADVAPSGKSDGVSFATGPLQVVDIDYVGDEPLLAWFHDNGDVDFTRFTDADNNEVEYVQATYKLYRYAGKDRIRLTDADGNVLLRSDRAYADGRAEFAGESWYQPRKLDNEVVDCLAMKVADYTQLEESLTEWEYPNVSLDKTGTTYTLDLGGSSFDEDDATLEVTDSAGTLEATATVESDFVYGLRVSAGRGTVFIRDSSTSAPTEVATVVCR
jgi:hypothetical protein